jgi:putative spermidine/putrescine transport system permease protein
MAATTGPTLRVAPRGRLSGLALLLSTAVILFAIFFVVPVVLLFATGFNPPNADQIRPTLSFTLANFEQFFQSSDNVTGLSNSVFLAVLTSLLSALLGYPVAYVLARTRNPTRNAVLLTLVLIPLQVDMVIRSYGMLVLFGNNGLINHSLINSRLISSPLPLMYNHFGVVLGLLQLSIPFMVLALTGIISGIDFDVVHAARSLGASFWQAFFTITLPLSVPGLLAGALLIFAMTISSYSIPVLLGGMHVIVLPILIYQQVATFGNWQLAAAAAVVLFVISLAAVYLYQVVAQRLVGEEL